MIIGSFGLAASREFSIAQELAELYGPWEGIRTNHVLGPSNSFAGEDGTSRTISHPIDRQLLLALRAQADLIVVDAATARIEKYRSPTSGTPLAIFSKTGRFEQIPALETGGSKIYLFSEERIPQSDSSANAEAVRVERSPIATLSEWAGVKDYKSILLESGPSFTKLAFAAGAVVQSALTFTPELDPTDISKVEHAFDSHAALRSVASTSGATFTLWSH
jgi:riboflavin biosynthesis pyrimidine reductase